MAALIRAGRSPRTKFEVSVVVSPVAESNAVATAKDLGVPVSICEPRASGYVNCLLSTLVAHHVNLVCLAGLMTKLPMEVLKAFPSRILNIHPALLPKFGGKGMYGIHVHKAVIASGEKESGCTVHVVTENYDEGPVVLRTTCPVLDSDTPETLAARVLKLEQKAYAQAIEDYVTRNEQF